MGNKLRKCDDETKRCDDCEREAQHEIRRKWPGKPVIKKVCGYHKRPYLTGDYLCKVLGAVVEEPKRPKGYAAKVRVGYAPQLPTDTGE